MNIRRSGLRDDELHFPETMRVCPRCRRSVPQRSGQFFCAYDGARMVDACPKCGERILTPDASFCSACGTPFKDEAELGY